MNSQLIETLEGRTFLSATPLVDAPPPDLIASLDPRVPATVLPGAAYKGRLKLTNQGGSMSATPINAQVFASDSPEIDADAAPFATLPLTLNLKTGRSKNVPLKLTLPTELPDAGCYVVIRVEMAGATVESNIDNNVVASTFLSNPVGHYEGEVTLPGQDSIPIAFAIDADAVNGIRSSFSADGSSTLSALGVSDVSATLSSTGRYRMSARGTIDGTRFGSIAYSFTASGQVRGNSIDGSISVRLSVDGHRMGGKVSFSVTKVW